MKITQTLLAAAFLLSGLLSATSSSAALIVQSQITTDTNSGLSWYRDLSAFTNETYDQQILSINNLNGLNFAGIDTWRIATWLDMHSILPSLYLDPTLFFPSQNGIGIDPTWYEGRADMSNGPWSSTLALNAYGYTPSLPDWPNGYETAFHVGNSVADNVTGIWITSGPIPASYFVEPPPPSSVPIPAAAWLLGSGLLGLAGVARKRKAS